MRRTTLADIIRRNTAIGEELPDVVFGGLTPTVAIATSASQVEEGAEISFTLTRTGTTSKELIVELEIEEIGAVLDVLSGRVPLQATFEPGQQIATITLSTHDDATVEFDGAIEVSIVDALGFDVVPGERAATVDVLDNDSVEILLERGLNRIEWTGPDRVAVRDALRVNGGPEDITDRIAAVYHWDDLTRRWTGYFPALEQDSPRNNLATFRSGGVYWIDASEPLSWRVPKADQALQH